MKTLLVTQRVVLDAASGERRDALDQAWQPFLQRCGLIALPVPNDVRAALHLLGTLPHAGVLLTGGNDLACVGGDAPERDEVETLLVDHASRARLPVLGVCRGMQFLLARFGGVLERVEGHARSEHALAGTTRSVNSFHHYGCRVTPRELEVWARADDGVIEAVRHRELAWCGIMWHPERANPAHDDDVELFRRCFGTMTATMASA